MSVTYSENLIPYKGNYWWRYEWLKFCIYYAICVAAILFGQTSSILCMIT